MFIMRPAWKQENFMTSSKRRRGIKFYLLRIHMYFFVGFWLLFCILIRPEKAQNLAWSYNEVLLYLILTLPYGAKHLGCWPKITNIQPILTIPNTLTSLSLCNWFLRKFMMNIIEEKVRYSGITKIELYVSFYGKTILKFDPTLYSYLRTSQMIAKQNQIC